MEDVQQLRSRLLACFPPIRLPSAAIYGGSAERAEGDSEVQELCSLVAGKNWQELDAKATRSVGEYLLLMGDEAFIAYLPAFLLTGADDLDAGNESVARITVYSLCSQTTEGAIIPFLLSRFQLFNQQQARLIAEWLIGIGRLDVSEFLANDIKRALLTYWAQWLDNSEVGQP